MIQKMAMALNAEAIACLREADTCCLRGPGAFSLAALKTMRFVSLSLLYYIPGHVLFWNEFVVVWISFYKHRFGGKPSDQLEQVST